jgi:hypothetical protein
MNTAARTILAITMTRRRRDIKTSGSEASYCHSIEHYLMPLLFAQAGYYVMNEYYVTTEI